MLVVFALRIPKTDCSECDLRSETKTQLGRSLPLIMWSCVGLGNGSCQLHTQWCVCSTHEEAVDSHMVGGNIHVKQKIPTLSELVARQ